MPLYEYECTACHRRTEKIQKFSDAELTVCPFCEGRLERTLTAPAIQFKGSGWYKDLYSSAKPVAAGGGDGAPAAGSGSGSGSGEGSSSAGKTDTATAAPAASATAAPAPAAAPSTGSSSK